MQPCVQPSSGASIEEQLALIRAHPELAGRAAIRGELTPESTREQQGAGLAACTAEEFARLQQLNGRLYAKIRFSVRVWRSRATIGPR